MFLPEIFIPLQKDGQKDWFMLMNERLKEIVDSTHVNNNECVLQQIQITIFDHR